MSHIRRGSNSMVAKVIEAATREQDTDLALNPCEVTSASCRLSSGVETAFVALTAHWFLRKMQVNHPGVEFQEAIFMPSRRAECRGGFDLSIGEFTGRARVRTMHKVLYGRSRFNGTRTFNRWCDESWSWSITPRSGGDYRHLVSMLAMEQAFQPFLILHICYCVHEYRRMGKVVKGLRIPGFDSLLRTVVVDLRTIAGGAHGTVWRMDAQTHNLELQITKQVPEQPRDEDPQEYLDRISARGLFQAHVVAGEINEALPIITLDELYTSAEHIWARDPIS
jgi:hypothetical protein